MRTLPRAPFERRRPDRRWRPVARARTPQLIHRDRSAAGTSDHAARPPALDEYLWPTAPVLAMYASSAVGRIRARSTRIANCIANTLTASTDWTPAGRSMVSGLVQEYRPQEDLRRDAALVQEFSAMSCASALLRVVSSCCDTARSARMGMRARARRLYGGEPGLAAPSASPGASKEWPAAAAGPSVRSGSSCSASRPDSSTILVSSSTKSGTPSVLLTIWRSTSAGGLWPQTRLTIVSVLFAGEARQRERCEVRPRRPGCDERRASGQEAQKARRRDLVEKPSQLWIDPMQVFDDEQHGLVRRQRPAHPPRGWDSKSLRDFV
jgi:hypothetical protein